MKGAADLLLRAVHDDAEHADGEEGLLVFVDESDDVDQRSGDAPGEHLEGDELTDGEIAGEDRERADPDDGDEHEFFDEAGERLGRDGNLRHAEIARDRKCRRVVPFALLRGLEREGLHGADAVDGLDQHRLALAFCHVQLFEAVLERLDEDRDDQCHHELVAF